MRPWHASQHGPGPRLCPPPSSAAATHQHRVTLLDLADKVQDLVRCAPRLGQRSGSLQVDTIRHHHHLTFLRDAVVRVAAANDKLWARGEVKQRSRACVSATRRALGAPAEPQAGARLTAATRVPAAKFRVHAEPHDATSPEISNPTMSVTPAGSLYLPLETRWRPGVACEHDRRCGVRAHVGRAPHLVCSRSRRLMPA